MNISDIKTVFERQFGEGTFPYQEQPVVPMTENKIYQFVHALLRYELERKLAECYHTSQESE